MLAKKFRLYKESDFNKLAKSSNKFYSNNFVVKFIQSDEKFSSFAVVASKKISLKAVVRNKIRRRIYEIIRLNINYLNKGFKIIIFVKKGVLEMEYSDLEEELLGLFKKASLLL